MVIVYDTKEYTPSELAKVMSEEFGYKVTPSVIRKWDNEIFSKISTRKRNKNEARNYTKDDLIIFNAIAVLRNMGYSVQDVQQILGEVRANTIVEKNTVKPDIILTIGGQKIILELKRTIDRKKRGFDLFDEFLKRVEKVNK